MRSKKLSLGLTLGLARFALIALMAGTSAEAQQEKVLHIFGIGTDGALPNSTVVFDAKGNLYGTTAIGGSFGVGTVFEMSPTAHGWTEKVLYDFNNVGNNAFLPDSGLVLDAAGNLYGTTADGGSGLGTVFELTKTAKGWTEKILHNFGLGADGICPCSNLIFDASGNLYGTASNGGGHAPGMVFELTPNQTGEWKETILHEFSGLDGKQPMAGVTFDSAGNLYGTTELGGNCGLDCGVVFELTPTADGKWNETVIHNFEIFDQGGDGQNPTSGVVIDAAGNLYGTTTNGGPLNACNGLGCGTVYELSPTGGGAWTESILHTFGNGREGSNLTGGLTFDNAGNLYGTTSGSGASLCGTIFKLSPKPGGGWNERLVLTFDSARGCGPGSLTLGSNGNFYGAGGGGAYSNGAVFEVTP